MQQDSIERIRSATFSIARRGYDKREVERFLSKLADWLEAGGGDKTHRIVEEGAQRRGDVEAVISDLVRHRDTLLADHERLSGELKAVVSRHIPPAEADAPASPTETDTAECGTEAAGAGSEQVRA